MENKDYIKDLKGAERRFFKSPVQKEETRTEGDEGKIVGEAALVDVETDLGWFREKIAPGAFDDVLNDDVRALFNHDSNLILARTKSGTLELFINDSGNLGYRYSTPERSYAKDLENAVSVGDVDQSSFAFRVKEESWTYAESEDEKDLRTIIKFEQLYDVSPVTYPAYQDTSVAKRSMESNKPPKQNLKKYKRKLRLKQL